jgi:hypothetical protein
MLLIKPGVRIAGLRPEIVVAVIAASRVWEEAGHDLMITSGIEGRHMAGSLHYVGAAVDLRTNDLHADDVTKLVARVRECLGEEYDVVVEADHLHIEFQPKRPLVNG